MFCSRCKLGPRFGGDTWCLACSAWEQIGLELSQSWGNPGTRALATDILVSGCRQIRAARRLSLVPAGSGRASAGSVAPPAGADRSAERYVGDHPEGLQPVAKRKAANLVKEEAEEESSEEDESSSEEKEKAVEAKDPRKARSPLSRRRTAASESELRREGRREERKESEESRKKGEKKERRRESHKIESRGSKDKERDREGRERKRRGEDKEEKKRPKRGAKPHRAGRKHQRLDRANKDPYIPLHNKKPGNFWDKPLEEPTKGDFHRLPIP